MARTDSAESQLSYLIVETSEFETKVSYPPRVVDPCAMRLFPHASGHLRRELGLAHPAVRMFAMPALAQFPQVLPYRVLAEFFWL